MCNKNIKKIDIFDYANYTDCRASMLACGSRR